MHHTPGPPLAEFPVHLQDYKSNGQLPINSGNNASKKFYDEMLKNQSNSKRFNLNQSTQGMVNNVLENQKQQEAVAVS
jgi:hypothetical protein